MRIISGEAGGRRLRPVRAPGVRPTSDKVRGALFSILISARGGAGFHGLNVLDLYAGTGAFGLEALSRGAAHATLVEADAEALRTLAANVEVCGFGARAEVARARVDAWLRRAPRGAPGFDVVFLDPPYAQPLADAELAAAADLLAAGGVLVVEHEARQEPPAGPADVPLIDRRRYGRTGLSFYRRAAAARTTGRSARAITS